MKHRVVQHCWTLAQAEKRYLQLCGWYETVVFISEPLYAEDGYYVWEVA